VHDGDELPGCGHNPVTASPDDVAERHYGPCRTAYFYTAVANSYLIPFCHSFYVMYPAVLALELAIAHIKRGNAKKRYFFWHFRLQYNRSCGILCLFSSYGRGTKPPKPMKAMASIPAVTSAMGTPFMPLGVPVSAICSRKPAKITSASAKPTAIEAA